MRPAHSHQYILPRKKETTDQPTRRTEQTARLPSSYLSRITCPARRAFHRQNDCDNERKRSSIKKTYSKKARYSSSPIFQNYAKSTDDDIGLEGRERKKPGHREICPQKCGCVHRAYLTVSNKNFNNNTGSRIQSADLVARKLNSREEHDIENCYWIGKSCGTDSSDLDRRKPRPIPREHRYLEGLNRNRKPHCIYSVGADARKLNPNSYEQRYVEGFNRNRKQRSSDSDTLNNHLKYGSFGRNLNRKRQENQAGLTAVHTVCPRTREKQHSALQPLSPNRLYPRTKPKTPVTRFSDCRRTSERKSTGYGAIEKPVRLVFHTLNSKRKHKLTVSETIHVDIKPHKLKYIPTDPKQASNTTDSNTLTNRSSSSSYTGSSKNIYGNTVSSQNADFPPKNIFTQSNRNTTTFSGVSYGVTASCRNVSVKKPRGSISSPDHRKLLPVSSNKCKHL
ncbi:uncharacterized protein LOC113234497 [Hyposmocoma kahamanoa]|uniref:uncharacterized protein LOC113234497 n=1 Tax=Hyposmocoma kahamanoa TaxID=1477025 RepID=UPI000E6D7A38|nr:uncharacterized protein LOC113234497 [Hyposmocoma kahamanoa]